MSTPATESAPSADRRASQKTPKTPNNPIHRKLAKDRKRRSATPFDRSRVTPTLANVKKNGKKQALISSLFGVVRLEEKEEKTTSNNDSEQLS